MFEHNFCRYLKISLGWRYKKTTKQYNCFVTRGLIPWSGLYHVNNVSSVYFLDVLNLQRPSFVCICSVVVSALDWSEEGLWLAAHTFFYSGRIFVFFKMNWMWLKWEFKVDLFWNFSAFSLLQCDVRIWNTNPESYWCVVICFFNVNSLYYFFITFFKH